MKKKIPTYDNKTKEFVTFPLICSINKSNSMFFYVHKSNNFYELLFEGF